MSEEIKSNDAQVKQEQNATVPVAPEKKNFFAKLADVFSGLEIKKIIGYTMTVTVLRAAAAIIFLAMFIMAIVSGVKFGAYYFFADFFQMCLNAIFVYALTEIINRPKRKEK